MYYQHKLRAVVFRPDMRQASCRVCNSTVREKVENLLSHNAPMRRIAEQFKGSFDTNNLHLLEQSIAAHRNHIRVERELTPEEQELLGRFEKGEVTLNEISRIVASKVFEKMLRNPDDFRFIDFFRAELLRMKQEETEVKESWAKEAITRLFAGKLPPRYCPECGHDNAPDSPQKISGDEEEYENEEITKEPIYEG